MILRTLPILASLLVLSAAVPTRAQEPPPAPPKEPPPKVVSPAEPPPIPDLRLVLNNLFVVRYNPLGIEDQIRFGLQKKLYHSESKALRDNFVHLGIYPRLNPAFIKVGPSIEIQPATVFNLRVAVEYIRFFGSFGYLQSFPSPASDYSDTALKANRDAKQHYVTDGSHVMIEPLVQVQVGPIALRNKLAIEYWHMGLRGNDRVFYDATLDTAVPRNGWVIQNDLDVLFVLQKKFRLAAGLRYTLVTPLYDDSEFAPGSLPDLKTFKATSSFRGNAHHRLGPLAAFTFFDHGYTAFNKPTILLAVNWYLSHRNRTGQDVSRALPYLVLGFAFQSDFLKAPEP